MLVRELERSLIAFIGNQVALLDHSWETSFQKQQYH